MIENIGHSLLIIAMFYFGITYGWDWQKVVLIWFAAITWVVPGLRDESKKKIQAEIELLQARTEWYRRRSGEMPT